MAIPADIYNKNDAEEPCVYDKEPENISTDKDQCELATQIRQCFEEFPKKLSMLKNTKLEGKSIKELQKIWLEIEYIIRVKQNLKMAVGSNHGHQSRRRSNNAVHASENSRITLDL
jgi:hypothetical protein